MNKKKLKERFKRIFVSQIFIYSLARTSVAGKICVTALSIQARVHSYLICENNQVHHVSKFLKLKE